MEMAIRRYPLWMVEVSDRSCCLEKNRFPQNDNDASGICPDQVEGAELWDFDKFESVEINGRTIILDRSVDIEGKVKNKCFEKIKIKKLFKVPFHQLLVFNGDSLSYRNFRGHTHNTIISQFLNFLKGHSY